MRLLELGGLNGTVSCACSHHRKGKPARLSGWLAAAAGEAAAWLLLAPALRLLLAPAPWLLLAATAWVLSISLSPRRASWALASIDET
jgi:hypothetical protein